MQVHLFHWHVRDTVIILEEVNLPHPRCPRCDIMVPCHALNGSHLTTAQCAKGAERKRRRLKEEYLREISKRAFQAYGEPLETVTLFKYLGRVMTVGGDEWPAVVVNLRKAWNSWTHITRILIQEGVDPRISTMFF